MGRRRRASRALEKAEARLQGMRAIGASLDLGAGLTIASFDTAVSNLRADLESYNQLLASVDQKANDLLAKEKELADLSERMLAGVGAKFGRDSNEYEMAGGTRKSERKRSARSPEDKPALSA